MSRLKWIASPAVVIISLLSACESASNSGTEPAVPSTATGETPASPAASGPKPEATSLQQEAIRREGFVTRMQDGRLWVFRANAPELAEFDKQGELAKHVTRPGAGPNGVTLKAPDSETLDLFALSRPGFVVEFEDGRLWVFRDGAPELASFREHGELAKHVVRPGAGPGGRTLKSPDSETIEAYLYGAPGFTVQMQDGRLWVFREGATELESLRRNGELAKHVVRPGAGPGGITLKAPDAETIDAYLLSHVR